MGLYSAKRLCSEKGMVLERIHREASEEKVYNGTTYPARPESYQVVCVSSGNFNKEDGYIDGAYLQYSVDKELYEKLVFGSKVLVSYDMSGNQRKAVSVELLNEK